ncbi:hypothetical protein O1O06_10770 [Grimontia hollisae]|uniref:hypothetical protein n=1 Tax=Grimontia hollisae TaxID=673 RepID=UPI001303658A|nr:hypothetical protein [Grimontia hollisae]MDF2185255.1 hypothetical protein [Grimontia hollisae]
MGLDTRGFMDTALRTFDLADRYYQRQEDRDYRRQRDRENDRRYDEALALRNAEEQRRQQRHDDLYGVNGKGGWLEEQRALTAETQKQTMAFRDAQIAQAYAAKRRNEYLLQQEKKTAFIQENAPLFDAGWQRFIMTGEVDNVFDDERVKGGAYDPRRYMDPKLNEAADVLEQKIPQVINGDIDPNEPALKSALSTFYESNLQASVGQKDPQSGKTIKQVKWGGMTLAADIQPEMEGEQPGIVITADVQYEGSDEWVPRPITQGRSTAHDDHVKVIPLEHALQDITGQLKLRRHAQLSPAYQSMFRRASKDDKKDYRRAVMDIEKQRNEALKELNVLGTEEQVASVNQHYDGQLKKVQALFSGQEMATSTVPEPAFEWAGEDPNKQAFLKALKAKGEDLSEVDVTVLERAYQDQINKQKSAKAEQLAGQIRTENAKRYTSR